ncbi:MAG: penicillin-binding transpeptidase domain-containing protein [Bacilli bacterium]
MNNKGMIQGICGGRNYNGKKLFSNAYDLKVNPASTMKPIFSYLLAVEYLNYNASTTLNDEIYAYQDGTIIHNADKKYMGKMTLTDAIGYSRNTTAVSTLSLLKDKISEEELISYLRSINLYDEGNFSLSYALGGMTYGTNPISIAGAYALLINQGCYNKPTTIKSIKRLDSNEIIYEHLLENKRIVKEESAGMMVDILQKVIDKNYYSIKEAKPNGINIGGKTGTNPYSAQVCKEYDYPLNCDKDIWFSGFSPSHVVTIWSGYKKPEKEEKAYFKTGSKDRKVSKKIFKKLMEIASLKNEEFTIPSSLKKVKVVKGTGGLYAPNPLIDDFYCEYILIPKNQSLSTLPYPYFEDITSLNMILLEKEINIIFPSSYYKNELYENIFSQQGYKIKVTSPNGNVTSYFITSNNFLYKFDEVGTYSFEIRAGFEQSPFESNPYLFSFLYRQ